MKTHLINCEYCGQTVNLAYHNPCPQPKVHIMGDAEKKVHDKKQPKSSVKKTVEEKAVTHFVPMPLIGTGEETLEDLYKKGLKADPRGDEGLRILVSVYRDALKSKGSDAALVTFWQEVSRLSQGDNPYLKRETLDRAWRGDIKAAQILVRVCPETIHLPFVAETMANLIRDYKYSKKNLERVRDRWKGFLPSRKGGKSPVTDSQIKNMAEGFKAEGKIKNIDIIKKKINKITGESAARINILVKSGRERGRPKK